MTLMIMGSHDKYQNIKYGTCNNIFVEVLAKIMTARILRGGGEWRIDSKK